MNHYDTLGVPRDADQDTIKKAFRKLAMQHHPDKGGDPAEFQKINEAYATLSDPDKRLQYDNPQARAHPGGFSFSSTGFNFDDIFNQMFGRQAGFRQHQTMRPTYRTRVTVSLVDSYNGADNLLQLATPDGPKVMTIKVPKGIDTGQQVRYDNIITDAHLIIEFVVTPDVRFTRRGNDLYTELPISVLDLIVGTKVEVNTINGKKLEVTIQPLTQPSQQIRLPGYGMPSNSANGYYGDQILLLKPFIPDNINTDIIDSIKKAIDQQ